MLNNGYLKMDKQVNALIITTSICGFLLWKHLNINVNNGVNIEYNMCGKI